MPHCYKHPLAVRVSTLLLAVLVLLAIPLFTIFASPTLAAPGINQTINFQGRLLNSNGTTVADGSHTVVFSLYTVGSGGANIWTETQSVTTTQGLFRVALGSATSLATVDFNQDNLYLGIKVGADAEMSPRIRFAAAPYAFEAKRVSGLTVTNNGGNTLNIAANKTVTFNNGLTFAGVDGKTVTFNNSLAFSGTDGTTFTLPSVSGTLATSDATAGQVVFRSGVGGLLTGSNNLYWDAANSRLGIGTTGPAGALGVEATFNNTGLTTPLSVFSAFVTPTANGTSTNSALTTKLEVNVGAGLTLSAADTGLTALKPTVVKKGAGTVDELAGFGGAFHWFNEGHVNYFYNFHLARLDQNGGTGTIGTSYGIYIESQKQPFVTKGYGLYQLGAQDYNFFAGKVGLGVGTPLSALDVLGGVAVGSYAGVNAAPTNGLIVSGKVGIGNNNPTYALDVTGAGRFSGEVYLANLASSSSTTKGTAYYDSDDDLVKVYTGSRWQADRSSTTKIVAASNSQNKEKADFVATGTNDQVTLQAAVDALPSAGGQVVLLEGTFNLASTVTISKDHTKFVGQGDSTVLTRTGTGSILTIAGNSGDHVTDVSIADIKVTGPSTNSTQVSGSGIFIDYSDHVTINRIYVSGFGAGGDDGAIKANRSTDCSITNSVIANSKNGIITGNALGSTFPTVDRCNISNNTIDGNFDDGIHGQHSRHLTINGNLVYGNGESGIDVLGDDGDTISNNISRGNTQAGIEVGNSTGENFPDTGHTIIGNIASNNTTDGILIANAAKLLTITGNTTRNNTVHGINLTATTAGMEISDSIIAANIAQGNGSVGIKVTGNSNRNQVKNNTTTGNNIGVQINNSNGYFPQNTTVEGNRIESNTTSQYINSATDTIFRFNKSDLQDIYFNGSIPSTDLFTIKNSTSSGVTATGVDGLQIDFATGGTTASTDNAGLRINVTSNNSGTGTVLYGLNVDNLSSAEANAKEVGIRVGVNWDYAAIFESGRVGIGTAVPLSLLSVNGGVAIGSYSTTNAAPSNGLIVSGNVGIGNNNPTYALDVAGAGRFGGEVYIANLASSASTTKGTTYYDTDDDLVKVYTGSRWQADRSSVTKIVAASNSQNKEKADYVATGTNDEVTIQAAIDALPSNGGSVVLLDGTFTTAATINLSKDNTRLVGQGNSTIINKTNSGNAINIVGTSGDHATDITISLLKITGPSVVGTQVTGSGIKLDYSDRVTVQKVSVSGFGSVESAGAVEIIRTTKCTVTESYLSASKNGIVTGVATDASGFPWAENCTFSNNHLFNNFDDGGHSQHSRYINWSNNQIYGNGTTGGDSAGIDTLGDESDTIVGNIINGTTTQQKGIEIGNSSSSGVGNYDTGHTVSGNVVDSVTSTGIIIGNRSQRITVSGNTVRDSGSHGISVGTGSSGREAVDNIIIGNISTGNATDGIRLTGNSHRNLVKDNIAISNANRGMSITVGGGFTPADNIVENNRFANNTVSQFSDAGSGTIIRFNEGAGYDIKVNKTSTPALDVDGLIRVRNPQGETTAPTRSNNGEFAFANVGGSYRLYARVNGTDVYFNNDGSGDYSEYFMKADYLESFLVGTITTLDSGKVKKATSGSSVHGIVSAFGTRNNDDNVDGKRDTDPRYVNVGLLGQLPVLVTSENGAIISGDQISLPQSIAGFGAKSTDSRGIARAMQSFIPSPNCSNVSSIQAISWPTEVRNENPDNLCWQLPNGIYVGRIMAHFAASTVNTGTNTAPTNSQAIDQLLSTFSIADGSISTNLNLTVNGKLTANGGLLVYGPAEFRGPAVFKALAEFIDTVVFRKDVKFEGTPIFNKDTAGLATIHIGQSKVRVNFDKPYSHKPVITTSLNDTEMTSNIYQAYLDAKICSTEEGPQNCQTRLRQQLLANDLRFIIAEQNEQGFTVILETPATQELTFSWTALAVDGVRNISEPLSAP